MPLPPIPEIPLVPAPSTDTARAAIGFQWNTDAGKRHKLGGDPTWLQGPDVPTCPACGGQPMTFYGQLDSIGDDFCLADCGIVYVFVCFGCFSAKALLQSG